MPIVGVELALERDGARLTLGRRTGGRTPLAEVSDGVFTGQGITIRFDPSRAGPAAEAEVTSGGNDFSVSRVKE